MKLCVASIGWNRPEVQRISLEYMSRCSEAKDTDVIMYVDNSGLGPAAFEKLVSDFKSSFSNISLVYRQRRYGLSRNVLLAFRETIETGYDAVVLMEDDIVASSDFIHFHKTVHSKFNIVKDFNCLNLSGLRQKMTRGVNDPEKVLIRADWGSSLGVSYSKDAYELVKNHINEEYLGDGSVPVHRRYIDKFRDKAREVCPDFEKMMWGSGVYGHPYQFGLLNLLRALKRMYCLYPGVTRCQHIGLYGFHQVRKKETVDIRDVSKWADAAHPVENFVENRVAVDEFDVIMDPVIPVTAIQAGVYP